MTEIINGIPQPIDMSERYVKATYFETVGSGVTSGTITKPAGNKSEVAFVLDEWGTDTDALLSTMSNGKPTFKSPVDSGGNNITTTLNISGEYAFSGTPSPAGDHAVVFVYKCYLKHFNIDEALFESESIDFEASGSIATHAAIADAHHAVYTHPNHSGDVTSAADGAQTIATAAVTLAKMADMATASLLGRNTAGAGVPEVLAKATALSLLNVADGADVTSSNETSHADVLVDADIGVSIMAFDAQVTFHEILTWSTL